jgi:glycosyltransferase involved in cell wall biosynthesis
MARHTGIGRYVRGLINALVEVERDAVFVVLTNPENDPTAAWDWIYGGDAKDEGRLEVVTLGRAIAPYSVAEQAWLPEFARARKLDLLHSPHWNGPVVGRVPLVVSLHDATYLTVPDAAPSWLERAGAGFLMKRVARKAARAIVPSEAARAELSRAIGLEAEKTRTIPLFVDEMASWVGRVRRGSCETISARVRELPRFVLYAGHHLPHKDVPLVVRAFARVRRELGLNDLALALAGPTGRGTPAVEAAAKEAGVAAHVHVLGEVTDRDLGYLYDRAAAFATASRNEGFGLAAAEAMSAAAPVVASDVPAHREVLGDAALFFPPGDEAAFAGALARVLGVEAIAKDLGRRGERRAQRFSAAACARATAAVYREALGLPVAQAVSVP